MSFTMRPVIVAPVVALLSLAAVPLPAAEPALELVGGAWYSDGAFAQRTVWVEDGRLRTERPDGPIERVDLDGGFVVPPFAEAHNHNLASGYQLDETIAQYLRSGVFYVKMLSNLPRFSGPIHHRFGHDQSVDVVFANGGVTASGGHPVRLRESLLARGIYPGFTKETLRDHAYFLIDTLPDLDRIWPLVMQYRPDFLKIFLLHSEEYELRRADDEYFGSRGLDPSLVTPIVERAHAASLRVSAHVNSRHDFRTAVDAGVDEIAHLPGYRSPVELTAADARAAAAAGVVVVTTASLAKRLRDDEPERFEAIRTSQAANLRRLADHGVRLAVGSDRFDGDSTEEVAYLRRLDVLTNRELLDMWAVHGPQTVFPDRRVGCLDDGCEASFLVLDGDPLESLDSTGSIRSRYKRGTQVRLENVAPPVRGDD